MLPLYESLLEKLKNVPEEELPDLKNSKLFDYTLQPLAGRSTLTLLGRLPSMDSRRVKKSLMGVGFETMDRDTFEPSNVIPLLGRTGVKYARCQTGWIKCEKERGFYDFKWLDDIADGLIENGIEPWFSLSFGNPLYTPNDKFKEAWETYSDKSDIPGWARGYVGEVPMYHGKEAMDAFLRYVRETAAHFKGRVKVYEVWDEPEWFWCRNSENMTNTLGDTKAAEDYTEFCRLTSEAVHAVDPDARIASVTAGSGTRYIRELGRAGIGRYVDIHCFHYYGPELENSLHEKIEHLRACLEVPGRKLEIWQGESGRASGKCVHVTIPSEYNQAKFLTRRFFSDAAEDLEVSSIFTASDFKKYYPDGSDQYYGMIGVREIKPKLAFRVMQGLGGVFDGLTTDRGILVRFNSGNDTGRIDETRTYQSKTACFRSGNVPVFTIWQPAHVDLPHPVTEGALFLLPRADDVFGAPVVIDPIRRAVYSLNCAGWGERTDLKTDGMTAYRFPVCDYPLIITDLSFFAKY